MRLRFMTILMKIGSINIFNMKFLFILISIMVSPVCFSQTGDSLFLYRRGSIYSILISHRDLLFEQDIENAFSKMPVPDKYNDHGLGK